MSTKLEMQKKLEQLQNLIDTKMYDLHLYQEQKIELNEKIFMSEHTLTKSIRFKITCRDRGNTKVITRYHHPEHDHTTANEINWFLTHMVYKNYYGITNIEISIRNGQA